MKVKTQADVTVPPSTFTLVSETETSNRDRCLQTKSCAFSLQLVTKASRQGFFATDFN